MDPGPTFAAVFLLGILIVAAFLLGTSAGSYKMVKQQDVIDHNAAYYDPKTAKFTWYSSATVAATTLEASKP